MGTCQTHSVHLLPPWRGSLLGSGQPRSPERKGARGEIEQSSFSATATHPGLLPLPCSGEAAPQHHPPGQPCPGANTSVPPTAAGIRVSPAPSMPPMAAGIKVSPAPQPSPKPKARAFPSRLPHPPARPVPRGTFPLAPGVGRHWAPAPGARGQSGNRQQLAWWQEMLSLVTLQTLGGDTFIPLPRP